MIPRQKKLMLLAGIFAGAFSMGPVLALEGRGGSNNLGDDLDIRTEVNRDYVAELHAINLGEIEIGGLASLKGQSSNVRNFGQMLMTDHQDADKKITTLADKKNITLENAAYSRTTTKLNSLFRSLDNASMGEFDAMFAAAMVTGHQEAIALVNSSLSREDDTELRGYLQDLLPNLTRHLEMAKQLIPATAH